MKVAIRRGRLKVAPPSLDRTMRIPSDPLAPGPAKLRQET
jgi:hypothetical protein